MLGGLAEVSEKGLTVLADVATSIAGPRPGAVRRDDRRDGSQARREGRLRTRSRASSGSTTSRASSSELSAHGDALQPRPFAAGVSIAIRSALDVFAQQGRQPGQILQYEIGERGIGPANVVATPGSAFKQRGLHAETSCRNDVVVETIADIEHLGRIESRHSLARVLRKKSGEGLSTPSSAEVVINLASRPNNSSAALAVGG